MEDEIPNLQHAFNWTLQAGSNELILNFWISIKDFLWDRGHWQVFIEWGEDTLKALQLLKSPTDEAWLLSELGWFWMEQDEPNTAQEMFEQARNVFVTTNHYRGICATERYLGVLAYRMGNLNQAESHYEIALQIALARDLTGMVAEIRNQQGSIARKTGDQQQIAEYLYWLGYAVANTGEPEHAEQIFQESLKIFTESGSPRAETVKETLNRLQVVLSDQQR